jgi:TonB-dependent receptor
MDMNLSDDVINRFPMVSAVDHTRDSEDFDVKEDVASVYGMAELYVGTKMMILPGLRYEHTSSVYHGNDVLFNASGGWVATVPTTGTHDYGTVLPSVNVRYAFNDSTNLRAAATRSLARPNYRDLVPYRSFDDSANTLQLGNPDLRPTLSWNADIMAEKYLQSIGIVSAGFFYKDLKDYIYTYTFPQVINGETFQTTQPQNGDAAWIRGMELAFQSQLSSLPGPLAGIGVYANYTLANSHAVFPARPEAATLPGQSRNVGNVSVSYERYGFSGRLAVNFNGSFIDQVAASSGLDRFYDAHTQVDFSASQRVTNNVRAYLDVINMNNALLRYYQGTADRPLQEEHYRWWLGFGVKVDWR